MQTVRQFDWLTVSEAAAYLKVKPRTLLLWVRQGKLPAYRPFGHEAASLEVPQGGSRFCSPRVPRDTIQGANCAL